MDVRHINDYQLFQRLKDGDVAAFDIIYDRYWNRLYRLVYKILQNRAASEDIVQDTFVKLWEKKDVIENTNILGYLWTISYRLLLKTLEKGHLKKHLPDDIAKPATGATANADNLVNLKELQAKVSTCVESLPAQCKKIYLLSREQNMPVKEIAASLGLQPKTVEYQITVALRRLRQATGYPLALLVLFFHS